VSVPTETAIVAFDGSPAARQAVNEAAKILGSYRILVVTVWEPGLAYAGPAGPPDEGIVAPVVDPGVALEIDRAIHDQAEATSREGAALANSLGLDAHPLAAPDEGTVANTILELARERQAAVIVVGSRGLGAIRARLEGSTSKHLLKHASCPVIVVHESDDHDT
jgi:nucleotide-binding universal stress UspA family protein